MVMTVILLVLGLIILIAGAEFLVKGASSISKRLGIPSLVIGLTVVAFGTSAPELVVNTISALKGQTDLALGNIVGSSIANILLILGVSATIITLQVKRSTTWKEVPFAALAVISIFLMGNDTLFDGAAVNEITRSEGLVLLGFFAIFLFYTYDLFAKGEACEGIGDEIQEIGIYKSIVMFGLGILGLFFGGKLLVENATEIARLFGMSEMMIGLTVVALGTSLPELATSVVAARRKEVDIAIGNVIGSNIFNIFWILGITSSLSPIKLAVGANTDILFNLFVTVLLFGVLVRGKHKLGRAYGILFIVMYFAYMGYLIYRG